MTQESATGQRVHHVVSVRLTDEDPELASYVAESLGVSASKAVRLMLRRADGGDALARVAPIIRDIREGLDAAVRAFGLEIEDTSTRPTFVAEIMAADH